MMDAEGPMTAMKASRPAPADRDLEIRRMLEELQKTTELVVESALQYIDKTGWLLYPENDESMPMPSYGCATPLGNQLEELAGRLMYVRSKLIDANERVAL